MPAQVIGAIGLTSTAAGAYYVTTGQLDRIAIALWLANWLFAGNQIHFVQLRIRSSRAELSTKSCKLGLPFLAGQVVLLGVIRAANSSASFPWRWPWPLFLSYSVGHSGLCADASLSTSISWDSANWVRHCFSVGSSASPSWPDCDR